MMKTTTWLCPIVLTLVFATRLVSTAPRNIGYPMEMSDSNSFLDDYYFGKRNKPSLSIVNPLDVLRNRLLLEMARRQMKENSKQVEANRLILKTVGKRMSTPGQSYRLAMLRNDLQQFKKQQDLERLQEEEWQREQEQLQEHYPKHFEYLPTLSILELLDILQQQQQQDQLQQQEGGEQEQQLQGDLDMDEHGELSNSVKKSQDIDDITKNPINVNDIGNADSEAGASPSLNFNQHLTEQQQLHKQRQQKQQQQGEEQQKQQQQMTAAAFTQNGDNAVNAVNPQGMLRTNTNNDNDNADAFKWHYYYRLHNNRLIKK